MTPPHQWSRIPLWSIDGSMFFVLNVRFQTLHIYRQGCVLRVGNGSWSVVTAQDKVLVEWLQSFCLRFSALVAQPVHRWFWFFSLAGWGRWFICDFCTGFLSRSEFPICKWHLVRVCFIWLIGRSSMLWLLITFYLCAPTIAKVIVVCRGRHKLKSI